jgi:hypothetical protein
MWAKPGHIKVAGSLHSVPKAISIANTVDRYGFFENQLDGGTWMTFDQTISGVRVQSICTNFNGTWMHGSYIKINGVVVASDHTLSPDGTDNRVDSLNRGVTTSNPKDPSANQYGVGAWMTRGHTVVIMDSNGSVQSITCYDTYGNSSLCTTIKNVLKALPQRSIVGIGTFDATSCTQDLRDAFTLYFDDHDYTNTWGSQRISQMFLGKRNSTP